ncbi:MULTISPECIES: shikimate dehydrogenase [unclassified Azospirillum]|uniref:shikimate dehydrogenase n=1 Tax=unclassified Azospirillum TaxID=2630922 RepID=UPI000B69E1CD|nr:MULTISPECIES: shikimate dehydrogenase [unclassified Azospirillum]SNS15616.1 shikimate dehydrogenase [Azospirillum sp. RU38E]SNS32905.1 shikimate dehydrogenase [Azospirillum sp. RU37A]
MSGKSILAGLIGSGIQASLTPRMHEREGARQGLRYVYRLIDLKQLHLDVSALPDLLAGAQRFGFNGLNITHPCKQAIIPLLDELSPEAAAIGAVNTVVLKDGRKTGHNTDWWGFAEGFRRGLPDADLRQVVQLGAGGAGAAVGYALLRLGVEHLSIFDVQMERAAELASRLNSLLGEGRATAVSTPDTAIPQAYGLVNTTPRGMADYPGLPVAAELLRPDLWVAEIIYFPIETALLRAARQRGCRTLDGGGMALFQAVGAFGLFTGMEPNAGDMGADFKAMLG